MINLKKIRDIRILSAIIVVVATVIFGLSLSYIPDSWIGGHQQNYQQKAQTPSFTMQQSTPQIANGALDPKTHQSQQLDSKIKQLFNDSVQLMQIGHHSQALTIMHDLIKLKPFMPEAHTNLGFIMLNLQRIDAAQRSFDYALDIKSDQANAYYGLALVAEAQDDYRLAMSAMRSYIHLTTDSKYLPKARAALWNWQTIVDKKNAATEQNNENQ